MSDNTAGADLTVLGNVDKIADGQLADHYAYPDDLQKCWVRGNMISSLDGGATEDGKSGGLGSPGDRAVFNLMRQAADVILMGAATVRIENYSGCSCPSRNGRNASAADRPKFHRSLSSPHRLHSNPTPSSSPAPRRRR